jgi:hypothetical protein
VKVTRPHADLSRESLAHRVEVLEERLHAGPSAAVSRAPSPLPAPAAGPAPVPSEEPEPATNGGGADDDGPSLALDQLQDAWTRSVLPAIRERSIPVATLLGEAHPVALEDDTLTLEFAPAADFHRRQVEDQRNVALLSEALHEVTGRKLAVQTTIGAGPATASEEEPRSEEDFLALLKDTFDAQEVEET